MSDTLEELEDLQETSREVATLVNRFARSPFVVEFTGTPKSGKSTTIEMVRDFLKQTGWKVQIVVESAALCPLVMKGHFFFNTWTTATTLAGLLDGVDGDSDILLLDRGLFDALMWLRLQKSRGQVTPKEHEMFADFVLLPRWRTLQNLTFVLRVRPDEAMKRENHARLLPRSGSLMNPDKLSEINRVLDRQIQLAEDSGDFEVHTVDTTAMSPKEVGIEILQTVVDRAREWADRRIAVLPRAAVESAFKGRAHVAWEDGSAWSFLSGQVQSIPRSKAEATDDYVQLVACGIYRAEDDLFIFDRRNQEKVELYGRHTLWKGTHVELDEGRDCTPETLQDAVLARLREDLHLQAAKLPIAPKGLVWTQENDKQERHLGVIFEIRIDNVDLRDHLDEKEFKSRGRTERARLKLESHEILIDQAEKLDLEPWSRQVLEARWLATL